MDLKFRSHFVPASTELRRTRRETHPLEGGVVVQQAEGRIGEGVVIKTELADDDEYVSVAFAGKGVKKLMASLANLKVIS